MKLLTDSSGETTGTDTEPVELKKLTATSESQRTGLDQECASTPGNAEVPECVRDKDGALEKTAATRPSSSPGSSESQINSLQTRY